MKKYKIIYFSICILLFGLILIQTTLIEGASKIKSSSKSSSISSNRTNTNESSGQSGMLKGAAVNAAGKIAPHFQYTIRHASKKFCLGPNSKGFGLSECVTPNTNLYWDKMNNNDGTIKLRKQVGAVCLTSNTPKKLNSVMTSACLNFSSQKWKITPGKAIQYMGDDDMKGACLGIPPSLLGVQNQPANQLLLGLSKDYCNQQWDT